MKKFTLLFLTTLFYCFHSLAQWTTGGTQITNSVAFDHRMFTSATSDGGYYVSWISTDTSVNALGSIKLSAYDSTGTLRTGWTDGGIVISEPGDNYGPQMITSEDDGVIVSWYGYSTGLSYSLIYMQKYSLAGTALWNGGSPLQVSAGTIYNYKYPIIVSDKKSGVFVALTRYDINISFSSPDIILQHIDNSGNVASGWGANGVLAAGTPDRETYPLLAVTKDQAFIYMAYSSYPDSTHFILNKFNTADGSAATGWNYPSGVTLARSTVLDPRINCNNWLFTDSLGNATVLWLDAPLSYMVENWVLFMNQIGSNGTPKLGINGKYVAGGPIGGNGIDYVEAKQDKDYNLLVTFNDRNTIDPNGTSTIDAYKITPGSTVLWSKTNIVSSDYSYCPKPVSDGHKGMFIFYEDVNANHLHGIALDSTGKKYLSWVSTGADFGQFVDPDGFDPNYDFNAVAVKPGRAVVAWNRYGNINYLNVFTCNLNSNGSFCGNSIFTGADAVETSGTDCIIYPNPFDDYATVMFNSKLADAGTLVLKLFDLSGKEVEEYKLNSSRENNINTSQFAQGMYFYTLTKGNEVIQNGKLIKQ